MAAVNVGSPLGPLSLEEEAGHIVRLGWNRVPAPAPTPLLEEAARQIRAYFSGKLTCFDLPVEPAGTDFQRRVWDAMTDISYGNRLTYGELADKLQTAPRAVGGACRANPVPIVVPCHRVLARNGAAGGYSGRGGLRTKAFLLKLEGHDLRDFGPT